MPHARSRSCGEELPGAEAGAGDGGGQNPPARRTRPPARAHRRRGCLSASGSSGGGGGSSSGETSECTAIARHASSPASAPASTAATPDLSSVYRSLELLRGYLQSEAGGVGVGGGGGGEGVVVEELLSHLRRGCPLARSPSKHLPRLDAPSLPPVDWAAARIPPKSSLVEALLARIQAYARTDLQVLIGREVFHCHLLVLQCYSSYFDELSAGAVAKVTLPQAHVTGRAFHALYDWMISPDADAALRLLRRDTLLEVLRASRFLGVLELERQCVAFAASAAAFAEETAFLLLVEARRAGCPDVAALALARVQRCFLAIVATVDFQLLDAALLQDLLASDHIAVHAEIEVFMSAVLWLTHDWERRRAHAVPVMRCVRFGWMPPWLIVDIRRNYSSNPEFIRVTHSAEVRRMMEEGLAFATTREACGPDAARLAQLVDALSLQRPAPRRWLAPDPDPDAPAHGPVSFAAFVQRLPAYRQPGALDAMRLLEEDETDEETEGSASTARRRLEGEQAGTEEDVLSWYPP